MVTNVTFSALSSGRKRPFVKHLNVTCSDKNSRHYVKQWFISFNWWVKDSKIYQNIITHWKNNTVQKRECEKWCAQNSSHSCLTITVIHTNLLDLLRALSFSYFSFTGIQVESFRQESSAFFLETERNKNVSLGHFNYNHGQTYLGHLCNVTNDLCFTT